MRQAHSKFINAAHQVRTSSYNWFSVEILTCPPTNMAADSALLEEDIYLPGTLADGVLERKGSLSCRT